MTWINRLGYGYYSFPLYNFYTFNVSEDLGTWFGESLPVFHFIASIPILFSVLLPWIGYGIYHARREHESLEPFAISMIVATIYSFPGHKEYRFLFPILPLGYLYAAKGLYKYAGPISCPQWLSMLLDSERRSNKSRGFKSKGKPRTG